MSDDHIFNYLTPRERFARRCAFGWIARQLRLKEQETGKKISKTVRRMICDDLDLEIFNRATYYEPGYRRKGLTNEQ